MSEKKRILFVTQELSPYTVSETSTIVNALLKATFNSNYDVRVLMPRFGTINERRHRLHEVVRLSGMNIIVDDDDYPLFIKVASLPGTRLQVYFLDNEEFFKRKLIFSDDKNKPFEDNQDRMIFFCKGVIETVRKFGWAPDVIHCHGWMTSLIPMYLRIAYENEPLFNNSHIVYSAYEESLSASFSENFYEKAMISKVQDDHLESFRNGDHVSLHGGAINYADSIAIGSEKMQDDVIDLIKKSGKDFLDFIPEEELKEAWLKSYNDFTTD
jgi:starch synthase